MKVIDQLYDGIDTTKIDELTAEQCASQSTDHINYSILASRVIISNHQKNTGNTFFQTMTLLYNFRDINDKHKPMISEEFYNNCLKYGSEIEDMIDYNRHEEISSIIKSISLDKIKREWDILTNMTLEELETIGGRSKVGCDIIDYYFFTERLHTTGNKGINFFDFFSLSFKSTEIT